MCAVAATEFNLGSILIDLCTLALPPDPTSFFNPAALTASNYLDPMISAKGAPPTEEYMEMTSGVGGGGALEYTDMGGMGGMAGEEQYAEIPANAVSRRPVTAPGQIPESV